jgi:hypothetical protein
VEERARDSIALTITAGSIKGLANKQSTHFITPAPHNGRSNLQNDGEDLRVEGNAPAHAGT